MKAAADRRAPRRFAGGNAAAGSQSWRTRGFAACAMITTGADGIKAVVPPLSDADVEALTAGDRVRITGVLYTARDAAHGRLLPLIESGQPLPIDVRGQIIYYTGPSPARPGHVVGSIGPTTGGRMDKFTPRLLEPGAQGHDRQGAPLRGRQGRAPRAQGRLLRGHRRRRRRALPLREAARGGGVRGSGDGGHPAAPGRGLPGHRDQRLLRWRPLRRRDEGIREGVTDGHSVDAHSMARQSARRGHPRRDASHRRVVDRAPPRRLACWAASASTRRGRPSRTPTTTPPRTSRPSTRRASRRTASTSPCRSSARGGTCPRRSSSCGSRAASAPRATTTGRPTTARSSDRRRDAASGTGRRPTPARPGSRSSCRTSTATSSGSRW